MARPPYPLEALRKLRDERADAQTQALAEQLARCQAAEQELGRRASVRRGHAERVAQALRDERERLAAGQLSGQDLLRETEFQTAARAQAELLERAESEAREALSREQAAEQQLRQQLGRLEADAKLVRNHEASFHERAAQQVAHSEEEAALEQWNARRR